MQQLGCGFDPLAVEVRVVSKMTSLGQARIQEVYDDDAVEVLGQVRVLGVKYFTSSRQRGSIAGIGFFGQRHQVHLVGQLGGGFDGGARCCQAKTSIRLQVITFERPTPPLLFWLGLTKPGGWKLLIAEPGFAMVALFSHAIAVALREVV